MAKKKKNNQQQPPSAEEGGSTAASTSASSSSTVPPAKTSNEESDRQQNIRVIRLRFGGKRWELPVFYTKYKQWLEEEQEETTDSSSDSDDDNNNNKNNNKKIAADEKALPHSLLQQILIADRIFENAYKRLYAREKDIRITFPNLIFDQIASKILKKGELVEIQKDRNDEHKKLEAAVQEAIHYASVMVYHKYTGEVFEDQTEVLSALKPFAATVRSLLMSSPVVMSSSSSSSSSASSASATVSSTTTTTPATTVAAAASDRLEPIWRCASQLARQLVLDSEISDEAMLAPPVRFPIYFEISSSGDYEKEAKTSFAILQAILETDWTGLVKLAPGYSLIKKKDDDDEKEETEENDDQNENCSTFIIKTECLIAGYMNPLSSSQITSPSSNSIDVSSLNFDWYNKVQTSVKDQTGGWNLAVNEGKRLDAISDAETITNFLKAPFDISQTISFPHYHTTTSTSKNGNINNEKVKSSDATPLESKSNTKESISSADHHNRKQQQQQQSKKRNNMDNDDDDDFSSSDDDGKKKRNSNKANDDKYDNLTHRDLQQLAKKHGISTGGSKKDMISRLKAM